MRIVSSPVVKIRITARGQYRGQEKGQGRAGRQHKRQPQDLADALHVLIAPELGCQDTGTADHAEYKERHDKKHLVGQPHRRDGRRAQGADHHGINHIDNRVQHALHGYRKGNFHRF